jgi:hypothetical protein
LHLRPVGRARILSSEADSTLTRLRHPQRAAALADTRAGSNGAHLSMRSIAIDDHERPRHEPEGAASFLAGLGWTRVERGGGASVTR